MNRILTYWPEFYRDIVDFIELAKTEDTDLELMEDAIVQLLDDQYVLTASESAIKRRELMLGIQPEKATETLEFRKRRILNRYQTKPPFTVRYLQNQIDFLVGAGRATVSIDRDNYILKVTVDIPNATIFREMEYTIRTVKPANMVYLQNTSKVDQLFLKETMSKISLTPTARLGAWRLGTVPFFEATEEVPLLK